MRLQITKNSSEKLRPKFVFKTQTPKKFIQGTYYEDAEWGIRIVTADEPIAWVKNCKTGWPILKADARCLGKGKDGHYYWIRNGEKPIVGGKSYPSIWSENEIP